RLRTSLDVIPDSPFLVTSNPAISTMPGAAQDLTRGTSYRIQAVGVSAWPPAFPVFMAVDRRRLCARADVFEREMRPTTTHQLHLRHAPILAVERYQRD
ncbi:MAG: hypothetical protein U1D30_05180, partial [Planctomycetota bacterium]